MVVMKISHTLSIIMYEMYCDELLTQCWVVEGILYACILYVMIKGGTLEIQQGARWWRALHMYIIMLYVMIKVAP